jgi:hypothetical protein
MDSLLLKAAKEASSKDITLKEMKRDSKKREKKLSELMAEKEERGAARAVLWILLHLKQNSHKTVVQLAYRVLHNEFWNTVVLLGTNNCSTTQFPLGFHPGNRA